MIAVLTGTRPELIKMAPVIRALKKNKLKFIFIHSGQHYSQSMDADIIKDLKLKEADFNLQAGSSSHAVQTGKIMAGVEKILIKQKIKLLIVHGDTNTTLAGALAAKKLHIKVAHVEAGLRSGDYQMPEEINRILVDRISDILFAPTPQAKENLLKEGIDNKYIIITGNTITDALKLHIKLAKKTKYKNYILVTAHRAENVDNKIKLKKLLNLLNYINKKLNQKIIWPMHPRTKNNLNKFNLKLNNEFIILEPVGYLEMLALIKNASLILTDSGGIQEEAYILKKPLMTLRDSTERPETLSANFLINLSKTKFNYALKKIRNKKLVWEEAFGKGDAGDIIVDVLDLYLKFIN